jgi:hypothetical protein
MGDVRPDQPEAAPDRIEIGMVSEVAIARLWNPTSDVQAYPYSVYGDRLAVRSGRLVRTTQRHPATFSQTVAVKSQVATRARRPHADPQKCRKGPLFTFGRP